MKIFSYFKKRRERLIQNTLALQLNNPKSELSLRVEMKANLLASIYIMRWLDGRRIQHCALCPSTDTLVVVDKKRYCPMHKEKVMIHA